MMRMVNGPERANSRSSQGSKSRPVTLTRAPSRQKSTARWKGCGWGRGFALRLGGSRLDHRLQGVGGRIGMGAGFRQSGDAALGLAAEAALLLLAAKRDFRQRIEIVLAQGLPYPRSNDRWRKRVGVEPTKDRLTTLTGFEVQPPHQGRFPSPRHARDDSSSADFAIDMRAIGTCPPLIAVAQGDAGAIEESHALHPDPSPHALPVPAFHRA